MRIGVLFSSVLLSHEWTTPLPDEAARHADSIFIGPGEDIWPAFLRDFRAGHPAPLYRSQIRTLAELPPIRRGLIKRHLYLMPNSIVVSRGCPHVCDFCYKEAFFKKDISIQQQRGNVGCVVTRQESQQLYLG